MLKKQYKATRNRQMAWMIVKLSSNYFLRAFPAVWPHVKPNETQLLLYEYEYEVLDLDYLDLSMGPPRRNTY